jgi:hypothetical protein
MIEGNIAKMIEGPRSISDHWISFKIPKERGSSDQNIDKKSVEQEDRSQKLDPSAGPDHRWIKQNLHTF